MKHPTEKPVDLYRYIIQTWTKKGDIVLDCFAGSFVNAIACIKTGRKYICIELDKTYYKQGVKRIENELLQHIEIYVLILLYKYINIIIKTIDFLLYCVII